MVDILKKAKLIKVQRNEIYDAIISNGFFTENFSIEGHDVDDGYHEIKEINFSLKQNQEFGFELCVNQTNLHDFYGSYSPGKRVFRNNYHGKWSEVITNLNTWLQALKIELELEEKWERLHLNPDIKFLEIDKDEKFTPEKIEIIDKELDQFKRRILLLEIPEEAKNELVAKTDVLKEHTRILSKVNWQQLFIGVIVNTIVRLSLTRESATLIWNTAKSFFSNLILLP